MAVEVPYEMLSVSALRGVIEEYILREGTDYGEQEVSFERKVDQVMSQIKLGKVKILFDDESQTCTLA